MNIEVLLNLTTNLNNFSPEEIAVVENAGFLGIINLSSIMIRLNLEQLNNLPDLEEQFLKELLKYPLKKCGNCLLIFACLTQAGLVKEASEVMRNNLETLKQQLLSLANQELAKQTFDF